MVKKISRIKVMYILLAVLVMFCSVCPRFVVLAADGATDDTKLGSNIAPYMHGEDYVTKSGYLYQNKSFKTKLNKDNASAVYKNPSPYECENTCFKENGEPAIKSNQQQWSDFLAELGTQDFTGSNDLYFVLYETSGSQQYGTGASIYAYYMWVPSGSKICMAYSANTAGSDDSYYNLYEFARVYTSSDVGGISYLGGNLASGYDKFYGVVHGDSDGNTAFFKKDSFVGYRGFRFKVQNPDTGLGDFRLMATNIPLVKCAENENGSIKDYTNCKKFLEGQTDLADNQNPDYVDKPTYPAESFYWDSMTCKPSVVGVDESNNKSKYCFAFNYTYSCPLMVDPAEMFSCEIVYSSDIRYQDGKGRMYSMTDTQKDTFSLNKHKSGYSNDSLYLQSNFGLSPQALYMIDALSYLSNIFPYARGDSNLSKYSDCIVKSAKIYVTVFLYHVPDPDTLFSNSDIMQSAKDNTIMSTDVRSFSFDLFDLKEDTEGTVVKPSVITEDVTDDDGNVVNKKVTDVIASDDSGKTIINITIDNSNKVEDKNNNVNIPSGGGGSSDDDDKNTKSFWKYVTGIVAFFTALLNSDSGLFAVIASYFKFIPADFWSVTIGAIVVIAILSIYRLAKKGG